MANEIVPASENNFESKSTVSLTELTGLSKPLCKLIDAVQAGIGMLYQPTHIRRGARAKADAALLKAKSDSELAVIEAEASAEAAIIKAEGEAKALDTLNRAKERI